MDDSFNKCQLWSCWPIFEVHECYMIRSASKYWPRRSELKNVVLLVALFCNLIRLWKVMLATYIGILVILLTTSEHKQGVWSISRPQTYRNVIQLLESHLKTLDLTLRTKLDEFPLLWKLLKMLIMGSPTNRRLMRGRYRIARFGFGMCRPPSLRVRVSSIGWTPCYWPRQIHVFLKMWKLL